jgi:hypothetical protein
MLGAVAEATSSEALVDSSKLPPGFLSLALMADTEVDVVHIVRDARAVANSELRSLRELAAGDTPMVPGRSLLRSTVYWSLGNLAVLRYGRLADSFTLLSYEALSLAPDERLLALSRRLRLQGPIPGRRLDAGHVAVGNPSRFDDASRVIRPDVAWKSELSRTQGAIVTVVSAPARAILRRGAREGHSIG